MFARVGVGDALVMGFVGGLVGGVHGVVVLQTAIMDRDLVVGTVLICR